MTNGLITRQGRGTGHQSDSRTERASRGFPSGYYKVGSFQGFAQGYLSGIPFKFLFFTRIFRGSFCVPLKGQGLGLGGFISSMEFIGFKWFRVNGLGFRA